MKNVEGYHCYTTSLSVMDTYHYFIIIFKKINLRKKNYILSFLWWYRKKIKGKKETTIIVKLNRPEKIWLTYSLQITSHFIISLHIHTHICISLYEKMINDDKWYKRCVNMTRLVATIFFLYFCDKCYNRTIKELYDLFYKCTKWMNECVFFYRRRLFVFNDIMGC